MSRRTAFCLALLIALALGVLRLVADRPGSAGDPAPPAADPPPTVASAVPSVPAVADPVAPAPEPVEPVDPETGVLAGTVLTADGRSMPGAVVVAGWRLLALAETGSYRLADVPPGDYRAGAAAPGHLPECREVFVEPGTVTRLDFVLVPGGLPIAGIVTDPEGKPIEGAQISVSPRDERAFGFRYVEQPPARPDGRFRIEGVPEGEAWVSSSAPLHKGAGKQVPAGTEDVRLVLEPAGEIEGRLVLPPGAPASPRYRIVLFEPGDDYGFDHHSDYEPEIFDGLTFTLRGLAPGDYRVEVMVDGVGRADAGPIAVETGKRTHVEIGVTEGGVLTGRVVSAADGAPIRNALVVASGDREYFAPILMSILAEDQAWINAGYTTRTGADGRWRLVGLGGGEHALAAIAPGYRPIAIHGLAVPRADDVPDLALPAAGTLVVRVLDGEGRPEIGTDVIVEYDQEAGCFDGETDVRGECRFPSVPPGRRPVQIDTTWERDISFPVEVVVGRETVVEVRMPPPGTFATGAVTRGGSPVPDQVVEAQFEDAGGRIFELAAKTDGDGRYRIDGLLPGATRIGVIPDRHRAPEALRRVMIREGENSVDLDLDEVGPSLIVVDAETGDPLAKARAGLIAHGGAGADDEGRIRLPAGIGAGVEILVFAEDYAPVALVLPEGEPPRVAMHKAAPLTLRILDARGRAVPSADVEIRDAAGRDLAPYSREWRDDLGDAQAGRYVYDLAPGEYPVRITHPDHAAFERKVRLPPNGAVVEIVLP